MIYTTSLVTCLLASLLPVTPQSQDKAPSFDEPFALTADGSIIDVGEEIGYAGPHLYDFDGDGKTDLLVSSFRGYIEWFRNVGTNEVPAYETQGKLQAMGDEIGDLKFRNW